MADTKRVAGLLVTRFAGPGGVFRVQIEVEPHLGEYSVLTLTDTIDLRDHLYTLLEGAPAIANPCDACGEPAKHRVCGECYIMTSRE